MLKTKIHAAQITNLTDARYFAAREVEWLTFNFTEGTDGFIEPMRARAMFEWVEGVKIVGEFSRATTAAEVNFYAESWQLQGIQVGRSMPTEEIWAIKAASILYKINLEAFTNPDILRGVMKPLSDIVEAFVVDFTASDMDWESLKSPKSMIEIADLRELCSEFKIILNIDFSPETLPDILALPIYGLSMKGGDEERVGVKSFEDLEEILEQLEIEI
jgi:phosphoribosylanthranilate isomerase